MKSLILNVLMFMTSASQLVVPFVERKHGKGWLESGEIGSLMDRQMPIDIIYDLAGRRRLVTKDDVTDEYRTFWVESNQLGLPYVRDPETGHKYLVKYSRISKGVDLYKIMKGKFGAPVVADWATMTVNQIKLNKYGEVELVPIKGEVSNYKLNWLN